MDTAEAEYCPQARERACIIHVLMMMGQSMVTISNGPVLCCVIQKLAPSPFHSCSRLHRCIAGLIVHVAMDVCRYMQIFSSDFCARHADHTVNIHHSFLPAFEGAKPYHKAHKRGVKIIGVSFQLMHNKESLVAQCN